MTTRIAFVVPSLGLGGAERSAVRLANGLGAFGYQVAIVSFSPIEGGMSRDLGPSVQVFCGPRRSSWDPRLWWRIRRQLLGLRPEVVIGWSTYANLVASLVSPVGRRWSLVVSERNTLPRFFPSQDGRSCRRRMILCAAKALYRKADLVTANSSWNTRFLRRWLGAGPRYSTLRNFLDTAALQAKCSNLAMSPGSEGPRILAMGRLNHQKGFDLLLRAFSQVALARPWSLTIAGGGEEELHLKALAAQLGVATRVTWLGATDSPSELYAWADMVVVPSRFEGFPNVAMEAMACGRAVIVSDCLTGPRELTVNGTFAKLVPSNDPDAIAQGILQLGDNREYREALGRLARAHVERTYDTSVVLPEIVTILASLVR